MKRLTTSRISRWQNDCERLEAAQHRLAEDVRSYVLTAKGGRYARLVEARAHLREAEASMHRAQETIVLLLAAEARRTATGKGK